MLIFLFTALCEVGRRARAATTTPVAVADSGRTKALYILNETIISPSYNDFEKFHDASNIF
jgi:hypothetical protein